jgi:Cu/Ag efflux pump CusA
MLLAGLVLALGVIVDDVIVGTEAVLRRFRERRSEDELRSSAGILVEAAAESRAAIGYATMIMVLVVLPVAVLTGVAAAFLPQIAIAYVLAIAASLVVALTVTPALTSLLVARRPGQRAETRIGARLRTAYRAGLARVVRRAGVALATATVATVAIVLAVVVAAPQLGQAIVPQLQERDLLISWDGAPGTSRTEMNRVMARVGTELRAIPGVASVGAHVGRAITSDRVVDTNHGEIWLSIDPSADYQATVSAVHEVVDGYPGFDRAVTTYTNTRIDDWLGAPDDDFVVRIYGQDQDVLAAKAEEIRDAVAGIEGVVGPTIEGTVSQPSLDIEVDVEAAARNGLKPGDIRRAATSLLSGIEVGFLFEDQKVFEVVVWGDPSVRQDLTSIGDLQIDTPSGVPVRLAEVASLTIAPTPTVIRREGVMRIIDVTGAVEGRDLGSVLADVEARVGEVAFPLEYHAEIRAPGAERQMEQIRTIVAVLAAAVGIFLLLQATFASWRLASMAFVTLPAGLVGGLVAGYAIGGGSLSLGALVGLVTVLAITVRNGISLIVHYQRLADSEADTPRAELVLRGAGDRLGPIALTALATAGAMIPFVLLGDQPGLEIVRPLAAVVLGGLVTSTIVTLFVVPAVYLRSGPSLEMETSPAPVEQPALSPAS